MAQSTLVSVANKEDAMKIVTDDKNAYVHLKGNKFLLIGEKKEVLRASPRRQAEMVIISLAFFAYNELENGEYVLH